MTDDAPSLLSETCQESADTLMAFLRSESPQAYTIRNVITLIEGELRADHDPTETICDARYQACIGALVGAIQFAEEDLTLLADRLRELSRLSAPSPSCQAPIEQALTAAQNCNRHLHRYDLCRALTESETLAASLGKIQDISHDSAMSHRAARILRTIALAGDLRYYYIGK